MTKKLSLFKRVTLVLTEPEGAGLFSTLALSICAFSALAYVSGGVLTLVFAGLAVAGCGVFAYLFHVGMRSLDTLALRLTRQRAVAWVKEARTADERRQRLLDLETQGAGATLASAGISFDAWHTIGVNIDGTPMGPHGLDIYGNPYGVTAIHSAMSDDMPVTGGVAGYQAPIGLNDPMQPPQM